jgi:hypothetical protein
MYYIDESGACFSKVGMSSLRGRCEYAHAHRTFSNVSTRIIVLGVKLVSEALIMNIVG